MKLIHLLLVLLWLPIFGIAQGDLLLFESTGWTDSQLNAEQSTRLTKIRNNYPARDISAISFNNLEEAQVDMKLEIELPNEKDCYRFFLYAQEIEFISNDDYYWYGTLSEFGNTNARVPTPTGAGAGDKEDGKEVEEEENCDCEKAYLILIKKQDRIYGTLQAGNNTYSIQPLTGDKNVLVLEPEDPNRQTCGAGDLLVRSDEESTTDQKSNAIEKRVSGNCPVDVLVVYTSAAGDRLADPGAAGDLIISSMRQSLRNSRVFDPDLDLRLIAVREITDVDETGLTAEQTLFAVRGSGQAQDFRDNVYDADIVIGFADRSLGNWGSTAGIAFVGPSAFSAYGVFNTFNFTRTAVHEIGHIFGCEHEPCSASITGSNCESPEVPDRQAHTFETVRERCFPWSDVVTARTTLMFSTLVDSEIPHFSNPDVTFEGEPTGILNDRNNARVLRDNGCIVADFRGSTDPLSVSLSASSSSACVGAEITLNTSISGGCIGPYNWEWFFSTNGIGYTHLPQFDNDSQIEITGQGYSSVRLEVTDDCGTKVTKFKTLFFHGCPWITVPDDPSYKKLTVFPNPLDKGSDITFQFDLEETANVSYHLMDITGRKYLSQDLGVLGKGQHKYSEDVSDINTQVFYLVLSKGDEKEVKKLIRLRE